MNAALKPGAQPPIKRRRRINESDLYEAGRNVLVVEALTLGDTPTSYRPQLNSRIAAGGRMSHELDPEGVVVAAMWHAGYGRWCLCREYLSAQQATEFMPGSLSGVLLRLQQLLGVELPPIPYSERGGPAIDALTGLPLRDAA